MGKDSKSSVVKNASVTDPLIGNSKSGVLHSEPIAPRLGVDYPFPPHLEYAASCHFAVFAFLLAYCNWII